MYLFLAAGMADADPDAAIVVADVAGDGAQAVVAGDTAAGFHPNFARRKIQFIVEDDGRSERNFVELHRFRHCSAGFVHERSGEKQQRALAPDRTFRRNPLKTLAPRSDAVALCDGFDHHESDVVAIALILRAGIPKPDEKQHGSHRSSVALLLRRGGLRSGGGSTCGRSSARGGLCGGPFGRDTLNESFLLLLMFMIGVTIPSLALSADGKAEPPVPAPGPEFDPATYGHPAPTPFDASSHFDRSFELTVTRKPGFFDGEPGLQWAINGHIYPRVPMFMVRPRCRLT